MHLELRNSSDSSGVPTVVVAGGVDHQNAARLYEAVRQVARRAPHRVKLDLSPLETIDSAGIATLVTLRREIEARGGSLEIVAMNEQSARMAAMLPWRREAPSPPPASPSFLERIGEGSISLATALLEVLLLLAEIFYWGVIGPFRRKFVKGSAMLEQASYMGADAVPIVSLTTFLVGVTLALLSSLQLRQFGANIFVANLVGVAMVREMGPLIAAIIVAGRSGSAVAAEIATMTVTEEIDAIRTMGLNPIRFIVLPKVYAITLTQPLITILSDFMGIFGGFLVAVVALDIGPTAFVNQLLKTLFLWDITTGLIKSVVFAWIIVAVGVYKGFKVEGGAKGVGLVTTDSVVICIFLIIVADSAFSLFFEMIG